MNNPEPQRPQLKSCGVLVFREAPQPAFLLMKHIDRYDLPKGHVDDGESDLECALRELEEETGIVANQIRLDETFRFTSHYQVQRRGISGWCDKTLVIFLAQLLEDVPIQITEHMGFEWRDWNPPHRIQTRTIDPLLSHVAAYWSEAGKK